MNIITVSSNLPITMCNLCLQIKTPHAELVFLFLSKPPLHPRHCRILPLGPLPFLPSDELADGERAAGGGGGGLVVDPLFLYFYVLLV
jgi:hypothetical protein